MVCFLFSHCVSRLSEFPSINPKLIARDRSLFSCIRGFGRRKIWLGWRQCFITWATELTSQWSLFSPQPLMLLLTVVVCVLQTWTVSLYLAVDSARTAAGLFITLARQSGTRCQTNSEILTASIVLNGFWKQSSLVANSVTSALEVIF